MIKVRHKKGKITLHYYLGMDNGITTTKAALYNKTGKGIASFNVSASAISPQVGFAELDLDIMWMPAVL